MRIYYFCLFAVLLSLSIRAQDSPENFGSEDFVQTVFANMHDAGVDSSQKIEWIFEFSHSDSLVLATLFTSYTHSNQNIQIGTIKKGMINDNNLRNKLEGLYLIEISHLNRFSEQKLFKKIHSYQKIFKKASIKLVGVGYTMPEVMTDSAHFEASFAHKPIKKSPLDQIKRLLDKLTGEPITYANIGITGKAIGTMTNMEGKFSLNIPPIHIFDTIRMSCIGYETIQIPVEAFQKAKEFYLVLKPHVLSEVTIETKAYTKSIILGTKNVTGNSWGFVHGKGGGAEASRLMKYKGKHPLFLNEVSLYVENRNQKPIKLLVNIYTQDSITGLPKENLMQKPLLVTSEMNEGWLTVNLNKQELILNQSFFVAFQWIDENTKNPFIALKGNSGYQRSASMDSWVQSSTFSWAIKAKGTILK